MMAAAVTLVGVGTVLRQLDVSTLVIILGFIVAGFGLFAPESVVLRTLRHRSVVMVIVAGVVLQALAFAAQSTLPVPHRLVLLGLAGLGIHAVLNGGRSRTAELTVVIVGHFVLMAIMLAISGRPDIDVYEFQQQASAALLRGENPYGLRFLNTEALGTAIYAPEVIDGDRLKFGFIYPPLSLLMALPGYAIAGDYRYAALAAVSGTTMLIVLMRRGQLAAGAALLVLFAPATQFVLYWGWTDPFVALLLALTVLLAIRGAAMTPVGFGLLIASKQYVAPLLIIGIILLRDLRAQVGWPWRAPRTPAGFGAGSAFVLIAFFLFSKQAFLHYYFLPLVGLAIAVAVTAVEIEPRVAQPA